MLKSNRSIRLPGGRHEMLPVLHTLDERDLLEAVKNCNINTILLTYFVEFDFVCLPFAVRKKDISHVRNVLGPNGA